MQIFKDFIIASGLIVLIFMVYFVAYDYSIPFWILPFWIIPSLLCGFLARSYGRSGVGYFFLSLLSTPLIGFIVVLIAGENLIVYKEE